MVLIPTSSTNALTLAGTTPTAAGLALLDDADATAQRTTLGLGTIATQAASAVAITGGTVSGLTMLTVGDGSTSAPSIAFASDADGSGTGIYRSSANTLAFTSNGGFTARILASGVIEAATGCVGNATAGYIAIYYDTYLYRDAANTLALRNTTNAQTLNIYNTWTNSTNYERLTQSWSSNVLYTGVEAGSGGGTKRLQVDFGGAEKALTDSTPTGFVRIACANDIAIAGVIHYGVYAKDDSSEDIQIRSGSVNFAIVNKAGGSDPVCGLGTVLNEAIAVTAGTLTVTFDYDATPGTAVDIRATATSSLTETSLDIRYRVEIFGPKQTVTPL